MTGKRVEAAYEEAVGARALERQRLEAEHRFPCCGERRIDGHHPLCEDYVEPVPVGHPSLFD